MADELYKVVFSGKLLDGFELTTVRQEFANRFQAPEHLVDQVFGGGSVVIKKGLEQATACSLNELLGQLGMQSSWRRMPPVIATDHQTPEVDESDQADQTVNSGNRDEQPTGPTDEDDESTAELRLDQERAAALSPSMNGNRSLLASWKTIAPVVLVLLVSWRWYSKLVPDALGEADIKASFVEACLEQDDCVALVESQWDQCLAKADYARYRDAPASRLPGEEDEFFDRLTVCLVDADGKPLFF